MAQERFDQVHLGCFCGAGSDVAPRSIRSRQDQRLVVWNVKGVASTHLVDWDTIHTFLQRESCVCAATEDNSAIVLRLWNGCHPINCQRIFQPLDGPHARCKFCVTPLQIWPAVRRRCARNSKSALQLLVCRHTLSTIQGEGPATGPGSWRHVPNTANQYRRSNTTYCSHVFIQRTHCAALPID